MIETIDETQNTNNVPPSTNSAYRGWSFLLKWTGMLAGAFIILFLYISLTSYQTADILTASEATLTSFGFVALGILSIGILGGMIGASVGLVQWLALKQRFEGWILYSALAVVAALLLNWSISYAKFTISVNSLGIYEAKEARYMAENELQSGIQDALVNVFPKMSDKALNFISSSITGPLFIGVVLGFAMGSLQWLILRHHFRRAGWWILANLLGWGLGFVAANLLVYLLADWLGTIIEQSAWQYISIYQLGGAIGLGLVLGSITGGTLIWLAKKPQPEEEEVEGEEELPTESEAEVSPAEEG